MNAIDHRHSIRFLSERLPMKAFLLILLFTSCLHQAGCNSSTETVRVNPNEKSWEEQVAELKAGSTDQIEITATPVIDDQLEQLMGNTQLRKLMLDQGSITDRSGETIASFKNLLQLRLRESPLTDISLIEINKLESLMFLNLPQADITAVGIKALAGHTNLQQLRLGGPGIDDEACEAMQLLPELRYVHIIGPRLTEKGVQALALIPKLQSLYVDECDLPEEAWDELLKQRPDVHFHLDQQHLDRDPGKHPHVGQAK